MKLRTISGEQHPFGILTKFVKTETLLRHIIRFDMIATRNDVFKIAPIFVECVHDESSALAEHLHGHSSVSCCAVPFALRIQCFATQHSSETSDDKLHESNPESTMSASTMEASIMKNDACKEKSRVLLKM